MRLIDADATLDAIEAAWEKQRRGKTLHDHSVCAGIAEAERIVQRAPTIDAAPVVHAYWRRKEYNIDGEITFGTACSECGASQFAGLYAAKYCYKCGARMDADAPERAGKDGLDG